MKIVLCGSLSCAEDILKIKERLERKGHEAILPKSLGDFSLKNSVDAAEFKDRKNYIFELKPRYMRNHFDKIAVADSILVVNTEKKGIKNYIGGNTLAEIMVAFYNNKKIFLLNPVPTDEKFDFIREEIEACRPVILNGNLDLIG